MFAWGSSSGRKGMSALVKALAAVVLVSALAGRADAEPVFLSASLFATTVGTPDADSQGLVLWLSISLDRGWRLLNYSMDSPANALNQTLPFASYSDRYGLFQSLYYEGGSFAGGKGHFVLDPDGPVGVFDRVYLSNGSFRQAVITVTAYNMLDWENQEAVTVSIPLSFTIGRVAPTVPEPASLVSGAVAVLGLGGFLARRWMKPNVAGL